MTGEARGTTHRKGRLAAHLAHAQHRNAYLLSANPIVNAATGIAFWWLLTRLLDVPASEIGLGYAVISMGTIIGVIAKGGLDTALIRNVPRTGHQEGRRLLGLAVVLAAGVALFAGAALGTASHVWPALPGLGIAGWTLVALLGSLLAVTWLQDAWFVAEGRAGATLGRNTIFALSRLLLPLPLLLFATPHPVGTAWAAALLLSAIGASIVALRGSSRVGPKIPRKAFLRSARRNVTGSAAEFLPGLLLAPIVLAVAGPAEAGYFGIAWTGATLLFLVSAAISRSALAEIVREDAGAPAHAIRRGARQLLLLVLPASVAGVLLAPYVLGIFGADYAREGAGVFAILSASALFVAPAYLYLALLRAEERPRALALFPAAMVAAVLLLTPLFTLHFGLIGAGIAWLVPNAPFGAYGAYRLHQRALEATGMGTQPPPLAAARPD